MRSASLRAVAVLGILMPTFVLASTLTARVQDPTDAELRRVTEAYAQAWAKSDVKAITGLYTSEAIRVGPEGKVSVGRAAIEQAMTEALRGPYRGTKIALVPGQTTRAGQDVYVSEGTFSIAGGIAPPGIPTRGRYLHTLVRVSGRWLIAGDGAIGAPRQSR
jgi:uncharacterized protein (TIGR02246 family)